MPVGNMNTPLSADQLAFLQAGQQRVQANMAKTGTFNGQTPSQNLAAVINQPGNPVAATPTPYISGVLSQAAKDTQAQQTPTPKTGGQFNPPGYAGDNPVVNTPVAAQSAPSASQGSFPGQLTAAQIQAEAQARIDKQRAAITGATNAANAARKNVFDYTNQITGDSRTLENGAFNETHNPFTGQTGYAQANLQRNRGIQDTANNASYQADITANNQKLTDFETLAPEQKQAAIDEMTRIEREYGIQLGTLTGQFNGQNTMQQNQNNFSNGITQGTLTGNYTGPTGNQGQGTMSAQSYSPSTGGNNMGWQGQSQASDMNQFNANQAAYATASPQQQQALHQQNTDIASKYGGQYNSQTGQWSFPQNSNTGINGGNNQSQGVRTLAGQNQDFNQMDANRKYNLDSTKTMADLTGYISDGKGGYVPTNAKQQQDLTNAWTESENLGTVSPALSKLTGIPAGTQTQAAKQQAAQLAISARSADNAERSTSANIDNMKADNARQDNALKLTADQREFAGSLAGELAQAKSKQDILNFFNNPQNAKEIAKNLTEDQILKMKNDALAQYDKVTPSDKQDQTIRDKAVAAAQQDKDWYSSSESQRAAIIKKYEAYYN